LFANGDSSNEDEEHFNAAEQGDSHRLAASALVCAAVLVALSIDIVLQLGADHLLARARIAAAWCV
jgi:hypothetical protein